MHKREEQLRRMARQRESIEAELAKYMQSDALASVDAPPAEDTASVGALQCKEWVAQDMQCCERALREVITRPVSLDSQQRCQRSRLHDIHCQAEARPLNICLAASASWP